MINKIFIATLVFVIGLSGCLRSGKRINGNGNVRVETRTMEAVSKIRLLGHINVFIEQGEPAIRVETDENLLQYVLTEKKGGWLEIKTKEHFNVNSDKGINVYVTVRELKDLSLAGSGNINCSTKFNSSEKISLELSGSGNIKLPVHAPSVEAEISGSGNIELSGETKDVEVDIAGSGDFNAPDLKAEKVKVNIAGSGDAFVYADVHLNASIAGSGGVKYRGAASVDKDIAGSGKVQQVPQ